MTPQGSHLPHMVKQYCTRHEGNIIVPFWPTCGTIWIWSNTTNQPKRSTAIRAAHTEFTDSFFLS